MAKTPINCKNWIKAHLKHNPIKVHLPKSRRVLFLTKQHSATQSKGPCLGSSRYFIIKRPRRCQPTQSESKVNSLPKVKEKEKKSVPEEKKKICKHCGSETGCKGNSKNKLIKSQAKGDYISVMENEEDVFKICNETLKDAKKTIKNAIKDGKKTFNDGRLTIEEGKRTILQARKTFVETFKYNLVGGTKKKKSPIKNKRITKSKKR